MRIRRRAGQPAPVRRKRKRQTEIPTQMEVLPAVEREAVAVSYTHLYAGKELRLKQQYFFVSASLQAAVAKYKRRHDDLMKLPEKMTMQMNDTHPTVAVAELMRILLDEEDLGLSLIHILYMPQNLPRTMQQLPASPARQTAKKN